MLHQLKPHAVRIAEAQVRSPEVDVLLRDNALAQQTLPPVRQRTDRDGEGCGNRLSRAATSFLRSRPGEEGEDRAGRSDVVAEVEVIRSRVVEVDCLLDEAEPQNLRIEVQVALGIGRDCCDVMKTYDGGFHDSLLWSVLRLIPGREDKEIFFARRQNVCCDQCQCCQLLRCVCVDCLHLLFKLSKVAEGLGTLIDRKRTHPKLQICAVFLKGRNNHASTFLC